MTYSMIDFMTGFELLGSVAIARESSAPALPEWLEVGLIGLVFGAIIGLMLALRFRRPVSRAVTRLRTRRMLRRDNRVEGACRPEHVLQNIGRVECQLEDLPVAGETSQQAEAWQAAVNEYRSDMDRLRGQVE